MAADMKDVMHTKVVRLRDGGQGLYVVLGTRGEQPSAALSFRMKAKETTDAALERVLGYTGAAPTRH